MPLWFPSEDDLRHLDTLKVRDLIIQCFYESQKENLVHNPELLMNPTAQKEARASVVLIVKEIFKETKGHFNQPTVLELKTVIEHLAKKSNQMGTPPQIVAHHLKIITTILNAVPETE
ncbi:hypothetical protein K8S19_01855 [bacterium]|nr:hypothetical protein [bacterium]